MTPILIILFCLLAGLSFAVVYLFSLMIVYLLSEKNVPSVRIAAVKRFAVIVPAHDEAEVIRCTLDSMRRIEYPQELYDVVVIADNCSDTTASIVREEGFICFERTDSHKRGKGYALEYAFNQLLPGNYDAYVVIDADSVVSPDFLAGMDLRLQKGQIVIQAYDGLSNPDSSSLTYLFYIGNIIENKLFYAAKERLGLPIMLRGNGMCFSRAVIEQHPWQAYSIVEDTEYGLNLIKSGIRIHFATEIQVLAKQPETLKQAHTQRLRWASGNATLSKGYAVKLMWQGVRERRLDLLDAGFSFFVLSKPLLLLGSVVAVVLSAVVSIYGMVGPVWLMWALTLLAAQAMYLFTGIVMGGITIRNLQLLLLAPFLIIWFIYVTLLGLAGLKKNQWLRTERT